MQVVTNKARFCGLIGVGFFCLTALLSPPLRADDAVAKGREIVRQHCTRCHVVPDMNPYGGIGSTPSFAAMKWLDDWERRFEVFYTLPPHPALVNIVGVSEARSDALPVFIAEIELQIEDIDAILAFARTLKPPDQ